MEKIGKYRIERKLGSGAMGDVWYGFHPNLEIPVAIKTLSSKIASNQIYVERFIREAKLAAKVRHNNIVTIYDADIVDNIHYIVMEYVSGGSLNKRLQEKGTLKEQEALHIVIAIAHALEVASKNNIVHRDIKPENIMLTNDGIPKLADLGIAKQLDSEINTTKDAIIGTPIYMSPEQIRSSKDVDTRADIYALGCTFFELIIGRPPYEGDNVMSIMVSHIEKPVPHAKKLNKQICKKTSDIIHKMMQKDCKHRYQNIPELLKDLQSCLTENITNQQTNKIVKSTYRTRQKVKPQPQFKLSLGVYVIVFSFCILMGIIWAIADHTSKAKVNSQNLADENKGLVENTEVVENNNRAQNSGSEVSSENGFESNKQIVLSDLRITMLPVSSGTFQMGSTNLEFTESQYADPRVSPANETLHRVEITQSYWLSQYEVQRYAFAVFIEQTNYRTSAEIDQRPGANYYIGSDWTYQDNINWQALEHSDDHPIVLVSYDDCIAFCEWLTERERQNGKIPQQYKYTLPTEAQWEYACRAGSRNTFSGGISIDDQAFYLENSDLQLHPVGQKTPNAWGFFDMHGNVWEFCLDRSQGNLYFEVRTNTYRDITDPISREGQFVICRGGSWPDSSIVCRAATRCHTPPRYRCNNHGFRLALIRE